MACLGILSGYMFPPSSQCSSHGNVRDTWGSARVFLPSPRPISWVAWNQGEAGGSVARPMEVSAALGVEVLV